MEKRKKDSSPTRWKWVSGTLSEEESEEVQSVPGSVLGLLASIRKKEKDKKKGKGKVKFF